MKTRTMNTLGGCLLALALGALAGSRRSSKPPENQAQNVGVVSATAAAQAVTAAEPSPSTIEESAVEEIKAATGARRWLLLLSTAEKSTAADMPALIRSVGDDSTAIRMLAARWAELDPKHMFSSLYADSFSPEDSPGALPHRWELGSVLFEEWTKSDLVGAIKALTDAPNFSSRESYRMTVANSAMKLDVEQGLRVMKDWNIRNYIPDMQKLTAWAASNPQHAAEVVLQLGSDYAGMEALKQVGKAWAQTDPESGLRFAAKLDPTARATLGTELMREWAGKNVTAAAAFAAAQPDMAFRAALSQGLVSTWGKTDPTAALAWSQEHLRGAARTEAIAGVIRSAAEKNLTTASQLVADMEPGAAQNRACASIFETWFGKGASERNAAFEWLASLPDAEARRAAFERVQWNWAFQEPDAVRDFLSGPHGDLAPESMIHQVARSQASKNPEAAMKWASSLPGDRALNARMGVLENWLSIRPEGAAAYVRTLPAGAERERAVRTVSQNLIYQSPQQAADWYRTLPTAEQRIAMQIFQQNSLSEDQRKVLDQALKR